MIILKIVVLSVITLLAYIKLWKYDRYQQNSLVSKIGIFLAISWILVISTATIWAGFLP